VPPTERVALVAATAHSPHDDWPHPAGITARATVEKIAATGDVADGRG
jgi:hypothetical protein